MPCGSIATEKSREDKVLDSSGKMAESFVTQMVANTTTAPSPPLGVIYAKETNGSHIFRLILYSIIFMFTLLGNVAVMVVVIRTKELHTGKYLLLLLVILGKLVKVEKKGVFVKKKNQFRYRLLYQINIHEELGDLN